MAGEGNDPRFVEGLITFLGKTELDWWVRLTAVETLHRFRDPRVAPALRRCLEEEELRNSALACLAERRDREALPVVLEFMRNPRRGMRMAAIQAAVHYADPNFLPVLEHVAIHDEEEEVRILALEVLDGYGSEGVATAASIREARRKQQDAALGEIGLSMESNLMD
jgi:HEAT repeat protein